MNLLTKTEELLMEARTNLSALPPTALVLERVSSAILRLFSVYFDKFIIQFFST
jgi:hypothetical protein